MFNRVVSKVIVFTAVAGLFACSSVNTVDEQPVESSIGIVDEYLMGIGDAVSVNVWRNPDLSVNVTVRPDGKISVPLVGDLKVDGTSTRELSKTIEEKLADFIRTPKVTVIVTNPTSAEFIHRIRVTGAVAQQRSIPYRKGITVLDVILEAGGLSPFANGNESKLYRQTVEGAKVYPIYLNDILEKGVLDSNYQLFPQDIITVPERGF
ncbi:MULTISPECIES: XrtA/PEP-CTERM system exopolysaccharide export protein [unclassified Oleiphilus]|uniref:XrtA/PEP-CTERM system exopolysaccharide export protein n=1 Tax=unclassified Oleiphilus TaxID=2631174 RepID=UPI0009EDFE6E|nr:MULTISPECIES: XrtA/PEP-CTERM system exopolysaccharide export protein [unclassified Oleiphilus]